MFGNTASNKSNIFEKGWCKFVSKNFIPDYFSIDWEDLLNSDELSGDNSTQFYLETVSLLLDTYVPFKRFDKCKCKSKPWITLGLQKSISVENKLLSFVIRRTLCQRRKFRLNAKTIETYFPPI